MIILYGPCYSEGFILHHQLQKENSSGDAQWLQQNYQILQTASQGRLCAVVGDRGFDSAGSRQKLQENETFNGLCPRDVSQMKKRLRNEEVFVTAQKRRAQTEGRIAILKNFFLNGTPRAKGFKNRVESPEGTSPSGAHITGRERLHSSGSSHF